MTKIVIAEDDELILELLSGQLRLNGFDVISTRNGSEALAALKTHRPDILVLDLNMPVLDGVGVLKQLQAWTFRPKVLVMTARRAEGEVKECLRLGAHDYMVKPVPERALVLRIQRLLATPCL